MVDSLKCVWFVVPFLTFGRCRDLAWPKEENYARGDFTHIIQIYACNIFICLCIFFFYFCLIVWFKVEGLHATNSVAITKQSAKYNKEREPAKESRVGHRDRDIQRWSRPEDDEVLPCHFALPSQTGRHVKCSPLRRGSRTTKCRHRNAKEQPL